MVDQYCTCGSQVRSYSGFYSRAAASLRLLWVQGAEGAEGDDTIGFFDHVYFKFEMPCNYLGSFGQFDKF